MSPTCKVIQDKLGAPVWKCNNLYVISCSLNLDKQTVKGSTALHYCCLTDNSECLKLLLRGKASIDIGKGTWSSRGAFTEPLYFGFSQCRIVILSICTFKLLC